MIRQLFLLCALAISMIASCASAHANILLIKADSPTVDVLPLGGRLFVADSAPQSAPLSPSEFVASLTPVSQINRSGGKYWLHVRIKNDADISDWVFDPHNSIIDRVEGFIYHKGSVQALQAGHLYPHEYNLHYGRQFQLAPGAEAQVLIYFESRYFSSQPRFVLTPKNTFKHKMLVENSWIMGCIGAMLVLSVYNLFLRVWSKDKSYIYYALYLAFSMLGWSAAFNMWAEWFGWYSLNIILLPFFPAIAFNILYYIHFLQLRESSKMLTKLSYGMALLCGVITACYSLMSPATLFMMLSIVTVIWVLMGLVIGIVRLRQGYKPALFFVVAFSVIFIAAILSALPNLGFPELVQNADLLTLIAQTIDMLLLALALAHRIRLLLDERESAWEAAITSEQRAAARERKANETLVEANIKLEKAVGISAEEMVKKNEFLRLVSHELRTPLHSIASSAEEWHDSESDIHRNELIKYISYGTTRLRTQVDNLVLLAETDGESFNVGNYSFELEPILERLSANVTSMLALRNVAFTLQKQNLPETYSGDGYMLEHLLRANLENACKYTDSGTVRLVLVWQPEPQLLQVLIVDTGRGMSGQQLEQVFNDFFQVSAGLDRQSEGLGLGLTVSKRLSKALKADFTIDSELGVGTTVSMSIPLKAMAGDMSPQNTVTTQGSVLIVEDNLVNAMVLARIVRNEGYEADVVHSGLAAIVAVGEKRYLTILMDIQMPEMDGITATIEIRKRGVTTPIIAVTANSDILLRTRCMEQGMNEFLVKPVSKADIQRALKKQLVSLVRAS
jgi:signal transduction histidine kinase/ActR/RegA family two-component response regulator